MVVKYSLQKHIPDSITTFMATFQLQTINNF